MLFLGYPSNIDERATVAGVDSKRRFEKVLGLFKLAGGDRYVRLTLQFDRPRQNLVVGTLTRGWRNKRKAGSADQNKAGEELHQTLHQPIAA
jgi:hypothetical protein